MVITKIARQKRNKERYSIYIDGKFAFGLDEAALAKLQLAVGRTVTPEELDGIIAEEERRQAMDASFTLLTYRSRSRKELAQRLQRKQFSETAITAALDRLQELGYLNDEQFARDWLNARKLQGKGPELIRSELKQKGIDPEIIADVISAYARDPENIEDVKRLVERKFKQMQDLPPQDAARRITGFLARRGFPVDTVRRVLRDLRKDMSEDDE